MNLLRLGPSLAIFQRTYLQLPCLASPIARIGIRTLTTAHDRYRDDGSWCVKERLVDYFTQRNGKLNEYLNRLARSIQDEESLRKIKTIYQNRQGRYEDTYPFKVRLENHTKTYENSGPPFLRKREIEFYIENGLIGPISIPTISEKTLQTILKRFSGISDTLSPQQYRNARVRQEWQSKEILDLACNQEIVSKISCLLGENIIVRFTAIHEIAPHLGSFSSLTDNQIPELCAHSDTNLGARFSKRGLDGSIVGLDSINVWISINGTNANNGPLYMFPKTHNWAILTPLKYLEHAKQDPAALERIFKLLSISGFGNEMIANHALSFDYLLTSEYRHELSNIRRVEIYTQPRECLIFSTHLLHGSDINRTSQTRLAISVRYAPATTQENEDNLVAVRSMFSKEERERLGLDESDDRNPVIQVLGIQHHKKSKPINVAQLHKILEERANQGKV